MTDIIIASNNASKIKEIKDGVSNVRLLSMCDAGLQMEIEETGKTYEENAWIKANKVYALTQKNVLADDSGLEVFALGNEPGIYSARYAKTGKAEDNVQLLIEKLKNEKNRSAQFVCVFALIFNGRKYLFKSKLYGEIAASPRGTNGFAYDVVFIPENHQKTFAEMSPQQKNRISHRALAIRQLNRWMMENNRISI